MQQDPMTLSVDVLNDNNPVVESYDRHLEEPNRTTYVGATHTEASREMFQFYRTAPKQSGDSRGAAKSSVKFTTDVLVPNRSGSGDISLPVIVEVSASIPVGTTAELTKHIRQRVIALLDDDVVAGGLQDKLSI